MRLGKIGRVQTAARDVTARREGDDMKLGRLHDGERSTLPADKLRAARLANVRQRTRWAEIPESRLVRRGPWLVDAEDDRIYTVYKGDVFDSTGRVIFDDTREDLSFAVDKDGDIAILERSPIAAS